jgi:hypothetical protein
MAPLLVICAWMPASPLDNFKPDERGDPGSLPPRPPGDPATVWAVIHRDASQPADGAGIGWETLEHGVVLRLRGEPVLLQYAENGAGEEFIEEGYVSQGPQESRNRSALAAETDPLLVEYAKR